MEHQNKTNFPYNVFPTDLMILIEEAHDTLNFPIEYFCSSILSAVSVSIGNSHMVKFKEGFIVKSNLYLALVGNAGDVKSHPVNFAYAPIEKMDKINYQVFKSEIAEYNQLSDELKKTIEKPIYKKTILKDFTPESLLKLHSLNSKSISIFSDELFGWINNFGRYSNSGEQETYLSLWNGSSISVDRKSQDPVRIDNTHVNIIGTLQTKLLPKLGNDNRSSNGFIERMLFAINENPKPILWKTKEMSKELVDMYNSKLNKLLNLEFDDENPTILEMTEEAKSRLIEWQNNKRILFNNDEIAVSILAKYEVYCIRIALIIQLLYWAFNLKEKKNIELFAVEKAIKITMYYFNVALKMNDKITKTNPLSRLTQTEKELYSNLDSQFSTKSILEIGNTLDLSERKIYRLLNDERYFRKEKHGVYSKQY